MAEAEIDTTAEQAADEVGEESIADAAVEEAPPHAADVHGHTEAMEAHHPRPSAYVGIAIILAIVTAIEIGLFYVEDISDTWNTISLLVLMVIKFWLVAMWFMHLRFEAPIFRRLFAGGIILAVIVYAIVLGASHVFPILVD